MFCRNDPCGYICIALTYTMLMHCLYVIICVLILPLFNESFYGTIHTLIICTLVLFAVISHGRAAYFDPGFVSLPKKSLDFSDAQSTNTNNRLLPNGEGWTICNRCDTYRPPRAHHCRICKRCVRKLDHHCPWVNNCVGEFNQKYFILFLFYIGLTSIYSISFVIWSLIVFPTRTEAQIIHSIVICIESCLFGIFVVTVFIDQVQSIIYDRSIIDQLKAAGNLSANEPVLPSKRVLFRRVFGPGPIIFWLFPCDMRNSNQFTDYSSEMYTV